MATIIVTLYCYVYYANHIYKYSNMETQNNQMYGKHLQCYNYSLCKKNSKLDTYI